MRFSILMALLFFLYPQIASAHGSRKADHLAGLPVNTALQEKIDKCDVTGGSFDSSMEGTYVLQCRKGRSLTIEVMSPCPEGTYFVGFSNFYEDGESKYVPYCAN